MVAIAGFVSDCSGANRASDYLSQIVQRVNAMAVRRRKYEYEGLVR